MMTTTGLSRSLLRPATRRICGALFVIAFSLWLPAEPASAATVRTWTGASATSGNWSTAANWSGGVAPVAGDILSFSDAGARKTSNTNNFPAGRTFSTINVFGGGYRLRGNSVTISNYVTAGSPSGTNIIDLDLAASGPGVGIRLNSFANTDRLTLNGDINLNARILTTDGPGDFIITGVISGTGDIGIFKDNTGDLSLSGSSANTYSGSTVVNAGVLRLGKALILLPGPIISPRTAVPGDLVIGSGTGGLIGDIVVLNYNSQIADTSDVTIFGSGELALSGNNDTIGSLTMTGGHLYTQDGPTVGTLTLGGDVRINAGTSDSVVDGRLILGTGTQRIFDVFQGAELRVNAEVAGSAGISLVKSNRGTMHLASSNTFNGDVIINGGTVTITHGSALGDTTGITKLVLGTLAIDGTIGVNDYLDVQGPAATLALNNGSASWNGSVVLNDDLLINVPTNRFLTITGLISGPSGWRKTGSGTFQLKTTYTNTYAGTGWLEHGDMILDGVFHQPVISGPLVIGNTNGAPGSERVGYIKQQQIGDSVPVTIYKSGVLALQNLNDTIGSLAGSGNVDLGSGTLTVGANNTSTLFSGVISGTGSLVKTGAAALTLTGTNTYSGVTSNLAGTLLVHGILSGSPVVQVRPGSVLGGTGQVQSVSVFTSGQVSPGASPGNLTAGGSVLLSSGALSIELNGLTPGTGYDRLTTGGTVTLGGTLNLSLGFTPAPGDTFTILNKTGAGPISGTFAGLAEGATFAAGGLLFQITYAGGNGNNVVLTRAATPASDINSITPVTSERMQILGQGLPFVTYILEATPHLNTPIPWAPIATNTANNLGIYEFIDAYADNGMNSYPARFYRVQSP